MPVGLAQLGFDRGELAFELIDLFQYRALGLLPLQVLFGRVLRGRMQDQTRMLYGSYKRKGYFYGSGVIEAGCKSVIGKRAKQSGMFWSEKGAEDVLAIRTALCSDRFDQYWDRRNAA